MSDDAMTAWILATLSLALLVWTRATLRRVRRRLALTLLRELLAKPNRSWKRVSADEIRRAAEGSLPPGVVTIILKDLERDGLVLSEAHPFDGFLRYDIAPQKDLP